MAYSIDLFSAFKAGGTAVSGKAAAFYEGRSEKTCDFKNNLAEAVKNRENTGTKEESCRTNEAAKRKTESRPLECNKVHRKTKDQENEKKEAVEKPEKKVRKILEEVMLMLDELSKLQQAGAVPADKQLCILENIKELIGSLNVQSTGGMAPETVNSLIDIKNIMATMEAITSEVQNSGSVRPNNELSAFMDDIKELLADSEPVEASATELAEEKPGAEGRALHQDMQIQKQASERTVSEEPASIIMDAQPHKKDQESATAADKHEDPALKGEEKQIGLKSAAMQEQNKDISTKSVENQSEEESIKNAVDGKIEKVTAGQERESKSPDEGKQHKQETKTVDMAAVKTSGNKNQAGVINSIRTDSYPNKGLVEEAVFQNSVEKPQAVQKADVINQIVKKAELVIREDQPEMRMQLEPENLGKLTLKIAVVKGLITAKFMAESYEVKQIIESSFNQLKDMLQEKGIGVESFSVSVGQESKEFNNQNNNQLWQGAYKASTRRSTGYEGYGDYMQEEAGPSAISNPYNYHEGRFDHRA